MRRVFQILILFLVASIGWADNTTGGDGGFVNLPGRNNSARSNTGGGYCSRHALDGSPVAFVLPADMRGCVASLHVDGVPTVRLLLVVNNSVTLDGGLLTGLAANSTAFTLDFVAPSGLHMRVRCTYEDGGQVMVVNSVYR